MPTSMRTSSSLRSGGDSRGELKSESTLVFEVLQQMQEPEDGRDS